MVQPVFREDPLTILPDLAQMQIYRKPLLVTTDMGPYRRITVRCPLCGAHLASYKAGPMWCENGLYSVERTNCKCGQRINWRGIPYANSRKN